MVYRTSLIKPLNVGPEGIFLLHILLAQTQPGRINILNFVILSMAKEIKPQTPTHIPKPVVRAYTNTFSDNKGLGSTKTKTEKKAKG